MTPTATKPPKPKPAQAPPSVSAKLRKLEDARNEAHQKSKNARAKVYAYDEETMALRVALSERCRVNPDEFDANKNIANPGTEAAKLTAEIKERMYSENPHDSAFREAQAEFHRHDEAAEEFKIRHCTDRLAELEPDFTAAEQTIRDAAMALIQGCEQYRLNTESARAVILTTPLIDRDTRQGSDPALTFDHRVDEWLAIARDIADAELVKPGLTPTAAWKLEQHRG